MFLRKLSAVSIIRDGICGFAAMPPMLVWFERVETVVTVVTVPLEMVTPPDSIATRLRPDVSGMNLEDCAASTSIAIRIAPKASKTSSLIKTGSGFSSVAISARLEMDTSDPVTLIGRVVSVVT